MKKNFCLIVFAILAMAVIFTACASAAGPDDPKDVPKDVNVDVKYIRIEPWYIESPEVVSLNWKYSDTQGAADMPKITENTHFMSSLRIKTKTRITLQALDVRKRGAVRKRFFISFEGRETELVFNGSEYGEVVFILHNDGTIEIVSPV